MLDFGLMPPEVTSAELYAGPGSAPMMAVASGWNAIAAGLNQFLHEYLSIIAELQSEVWAGRAAEAMAAGAALFADWAESTATVAAQTAGQARAAAAAFETAHATITPPAAVAANRALLAHLVATNVLGQNTARIATVEAEHQAMWANNTHALYGYAAASSMATQLSLVTQPPQTTNPAGASVAAASSATGSGASHLQALSQLLSTVPQQLSAAAAPSSGASAPVGIPIPQSFVKFLEDINSATGIPDIWILESMRDVGAVGSAILNVAGYFTDASAFTPPGLAAATSPAGLAGSTAGEGVGRVVRASVGEATAMGRLSAPSAWAEVTPVAAVNEQWLSSATSGAAPRVSVAGTGPAAAMGPMVAAAGAAAARKASRPSVSAILQTPPPRYQMPRPSSGG